MGSGLVGRGGMKWSRVGLGGVGWTGLGKNELKLQQRRW